MIKRFLNSVRGDEQTNDESDKIDPGTSHVMAVSPSSITLTPESARTMSYWCKTLFVCDWPDVASPGMLDPVTTHPTDEVDVAIHATPREDGDVVKQFESAIISLQRQLAHEENSGLPSQVSTQRRINDHNEILSQLKDGSQKVFDTSVYVTVRAVGEGRTERVAELVGSELGKRQIHVIPADYRQGDGLSSTSPVAKDMLAHDVPDVTVPMLGRALGALFPWSATTVLEDDGIFYGVHATTESPVFIDRYARKNGYNILTAGMIGAGKTYGTSLLNLRQIGKDEDTILVLIDPRDGFRTMAESLDAEIITVDGTKGLNPLEIKPTPSHILRENPQLDPFRQTFSGAMGFFETFFRAAGGNEPLSKTERGVLSEALRRAYADAGITDDPQTHGHRSPTVTDVQRVLSECEHDPEGFLAEMEDDDSLVDLIGAPKPSEGHLRKWQSAAEDLLVAMHPFRTAEYAHLSGQSDVDFSGKKVTYIDLQQHESEQKIGMMMQLLLNAIYQRAKSSPKRVVICIDEAHYLLQNEDALDWLERLTRHSRHFNLSLHLVTQEVADFLVNEQAVTIANNCSQKIFYRLPGLKDEHAKALGLNEREAEFVRQAQPGDPARGFAHALVNIQDGPTLPIKVSSLFELEEELIEGEEITQEGAYGDHEYKMLGGRVTD